MPHPKDTPLTDTPLTDEQRAIVAHDQGPALVFAVAGAGKTTAMTYRIERLVRENVFPARAILATSFSKASVGDIKAALARWPHCAPVQVQTLHGVGWGLLKIAQRRGHLPDLALSSEEDNAESQLLGRVLSRAWREKVVLCAGVGRTRPSGLSHLCRRDESEPLVRRFGTPLKLPPVREALSPGRPPPRRASRGTATSTGCTSAFVLPRKTC